MKSATEQTINANPAFQRMLLTVACAGATTLWAQLLLVMAGA